MHSSNTSRLWQPHYRQGPDYRFGDDVSFGDIRDQFGLSGVKVGRWVDKAERQQAANLIFDALADLAFILNVPPQTLGLRGQLNLAFGTGGQPGVQAHYAPASKTLALAKNAGSGALAHEFWHAFDHHVAEKAFEQRHHGIRFASHLWLQHEPLRAHPINHALSQLFEAVFAPNTDDHGEYLTQAMALDKQLGRTYFALPTELMARAFEACVQGDNRIKNQYLVSGTKQSDLAKAGAYPSSEHLRKIRSATLSYFELLGRSL